MAAEKKDREIYVRENKHVMKPSECIQFFSFDNHLLFSITWMPFYALFRIKEMGCVYHVSYHRIFEDALFRSLDIHFLYRRPLINELTPESSFFNRIPSIALNSTIRDTTNVKIIDMRTPHLPYEALTEEKFKALSEKEKCEDDLMKKYFQNKYEWMKEMFEHHFKRKLISRPDESGYDFVEEEKKNK